jgi:AcrR family transcriptional regulator
MKVKRKTQGERTAATREALIAAARPLFASAGYGGVGTEMIVREAGVSRGALYHQFGDKTDLFAAVFEAVEADVIGSIAAQVGDQPTLNPVQKIQLAARCWLDACEDPGLVRIALVDAPAVLGWARWREIGDRYGLALAQRLIAEATAVGQIDPQPVEPLAYVLLGALRESALYIANTKSDRARVRAEIGAVIDRLIGRFSSTA